jgi:hypothetical protein
MAADPEEAVSIRGALVAPSTGTGVGATPSARRSSLDSHW